MLATAMRHERMRTSDMIDMSGEMRTYTTGRSWTLTTITRSQVAPRNRSRTMVHTVLSAGETKKLRTPDGRDLAYVDFGADDSPLVIHNHGGPSSRLEGTLVASGAIGHGLRLVSVDRPGTGQSSPQDNRTFEDWADDLVTLADALGYQQFGVSGWSEGGPWAMAAAAYVDPNRLRHVAYLAGAAYGAFGDN